MRLSCVILIGDYLELFFLHTPSKPSLTEAVDWHFKVGLARRSNSMARLRLKCPFGHFNRDWRTRFWHSKWNSSTGRSTAAFSTAMSVSSKQSQAQPCPFNRDCEPRNLTWGDQNPLNGAESHIELPIDTAAPCLQNSTFAARRRRSPPTTNSGLRCYLWSFRRNGVFESAEPGPVVKARLFCRTRQSCQNR